MCTGRWGRPMAKRRPRDPKKPNPWWNAPIGRMVVAVRKLKRDRRGQLAPAESERAQPIPKRVRAKIHRALKREFGLTRRHMGAIGAGHMVPPWEARVL